MASDSRTNAGYDQVNVCRKMHTFLLPGERAFVLLTSGSLSLTQSTITLLQDDFQQGKGLAQADSMYAAARVVGDAVRRVSDLDRAALERDDYNFNIHLLLGGQVKGGPSALYAMLSFDATIRSNVTVGPPLELLLYRDGALDFTEYRRFAADDAELLELHARWETALRRAVEDLPRLHYAERPTAVQQLLMETAARP